MSTYTAVATRREQVWIVHVPEIDQWTQARTDDEIGPMAQDLIAVWLDVPLDTVDVKVTNASRRNRPATVERPMANRTLGKTPCQAERFP
jgi:predicted RNase H-like HicB family nuclease